MKIVTIIGARPQIIKAAAISRAIRNDFAGSIKEIIVHTGQHYDENMSQVFIEQLGIPKPDYNLTAGSGSHGEQTAKMLAGIEKIILDTKPNAVVVYGDTNSTAAGGLAASKLHIPLVHIEAGLRSFNKSMPEEINRILCDHMSTLLFSPTKEGIKNLEKEGFKMNNVAPYTIDNPKVYHCGDVMYDNSLYFSVVSDKNSEILKNIGIEKNNFILLTAHRPSNTDDQRSLTNIMEALLELSEKSSQPVVFPVHPRTKKQMDALLPSTVNDKIVKRFKLIPPCSFLDMIALEKNASMVITDSGGVQKEAFFFKKPCLILREETEWVEIVKNGNADLCGADSKKIISSYLRLASKATSMTYPDFYGDGKSATFICSEILKNLG